MGGVSDHRIDNNERSFQTVDNYVTCDKKNLYKVEKKKVTQKTKYTISISGAISIQGK